MIIRAEECKKETRVAMREGPGEVNITNFVSKVELNEKGRMFAKLHFEPNCGIGIHEHNNESEIFVVINGEAEYVDDETVYTIKEGDIAIVESGHKHAITNKANVPCDVVALIVNK